MRRLFIILTMTLFGFTAAPSFANTWQWQPDQIEADQQRRAKCRAAEPARHLLEKMSPDSQRRNTAKSVPATPTPTSGN